ncbi:hypothetical protein [Phenylobacterium sp.]|uniref:hypothetical protein n=1 Tax=Phenylobacterium sp. TaxID=1871053 RepID=UPI0025E9419C|nr:hypothetical protein [Phenylobacterium sp.]
MALTANAMDHQVREYLEIGMDDYLAKPIAVDRLFALLVSVESARVDLNDVQAGHDDFAPQRITGSSQ